jgi:hypothetical protein
MMALPMAGAAPPVMAGNPPSTPSPDKAKPKKTPLPAATPAAKVRTAPVPGTGARSGGAPVDRGSPSGKNLSTSTIADTGVSDAPESRAVTGPTDGDAPGGGSDPSGTTSGPPGGGGPTSPGDGQARGVTVDSAGSTGGEAAAEAAGDGLDGSPALSFRPDGTGLLDPGGPVISAVSRVPSTGLFLAALLALATGGLWVVFSFHRRRHSATVIPVVASEVPAPFTVLPGSKRPDSRDPLVASRYRPAEDAAEGIESESGPSRDRSLPRSQPAWLERLDAARDEAAGS